MLNDSSNFIQVEAKKGSTEYDDEYNVGSAKKSDSDSSHFKPIEYKEGTDQIMNPPEKRKRGRPPLASKFLNIRDLEKNLLHNNQMSG